MGEARRRKKSGVTSRPRSALPDALPPRRVQQGTNGRLAAFLAPRRGRTVPALLAALVDTDGALSAELFHGPSETIHEGEIG